jgi:hypothetical protein
MADLLGPTVLKTAQTVAPNYIAAIPTIDPGVPMLTVLIASLVSAVVGFGLGWYFLGGGSTEINMIKNDITALKAKVGL